MIPFLLPGNKYSYLVSKQDQNLKFSPGSTEIVFFFLPLKISEMQGTHALSEMVSKHFSLSAAS